MLKSHLSFPKIEIPKLIMHFNFNISLIKSSYIRQKKNKQSKNLSCIQFSYTLSFFHFTWSRTNPKQCPRPRVRSVSKSTNNKSEESAVSRRPYLRKGIPIFRGSKKLLIEIKVSHVFSPLRAVVYLHDRMLQVRNIFFLSLLLSFLIFLPSTFHFVVVFFSFKIFFSFLYFYLFSVLECRHRMFVCRSSFQASLLVYVEAGECSGSIFY